MVVLAAPCCTHTGLYLVMFFYLRVIHFCKIALFACMLASRGCMCDAVVSFEMSLSISDRKKSCVVGIYDTWAQKFEIVVGFHADGYTVALVLC